MVCATNACGLSISDTVKVPPVVSGALVSARLTVAELSTAASFVPVMMTCTFVGVPSAADTAKVSETDCPTFSPSNALFAV